MEYSIYPIFFSDRYSDKNSIYTHFTLSGNSAVFLLFISIFYTSI